MRTKFARIAALRKAGRAEAAEKKNADAITALQTKATNIEKKNAEQDTAITKVQSTADTAVQTATGSNGVQVTKSGTGLTIKGVEATQSAAGVMSAKDKKAIDRELRSLIPKGSSIPANADLDTITYLKVGSYYCISIDNAKTIKKLFLP